MPESREHSPYRLLCDQLRTIGHPERLNILLALAAQGRTTQELQAITGLPANTLHNHLHKMRTLHIIGQTRFHRVVQYALAGGHIAGIVEAARQQLHEAPPQHTGKTDENRHMEH